MAAVSGKLPDTLIALSEVKSWPEALTEWRLDSIEHFNVSPDSKSCLCTHPIRQVCRIVNIRNRHTALVGDCCLSEFEGETAFEGDHKIFEALKRIKIDSSASPNATKTLSEDRTKLADRRLVEAVHIQEILNDLDREMIESLKKQRPSEAQWKLNSYYLNWPWWTEPPKRDLLPTRASQILLNMKQNLSCADVVLKGSDGEVRIYRSLLLDLPYFSNRSVDQMQEKQATGVIKFTFSEITVETLKLFADYQHGIELPKETYIDQLVELYKLAQYLNHPALMSRILALLFGVINNENKNFVLPVLVNCFISGPTSIAIRYSTCLFDTMDCLPENELFLSAVEQQFAPAQNRLGRCYYKGEGVAQDRQKAAHFFRLAADQKFAYAQYNLAECYRIGDGVAKDMQEAVRLYQLAADQGHEEAQFALGNCYKSGEGVEKDEQKAAQLYLAAAVEKPQSAEYKISIFYQYGAGFAPAQYQIGLCYWNGIGVERDQERAKFFFRLAFGQGLRVAESYLAYDYGREC